MAKRKAISKLVRFEVFKRDSFKCQYCGRSAPDVVLHVDHINPVSKGGDNEIINLVTSCADCNGGKGARELDDNSSIERQRKQLEELNVRREQLEMMLQWREGMKGIDEQQVQAVCEAWKKATDGRFYLNEAGQKEAKSHIKKFGLNAVLDAVEVASDRYIKKGDDGVVTQDSADMAWLKVGAIARMAGLPQDERRIYYIRGILRNRIYVNESYIIQLLKNAAAAGCDMGDVEIEAKTCRNWTQFTSTVQEMIEAQQNG